MKGGKKRILSLCILLFAASICTAADRSHDAELSDLYVEKARILYGEYKYTEAERLLDIALEFEEKNPDALYLKGLISAQERGGRRDAVRLFQQALAEPQWNIFRREEASYSLGSVLLTLRQASQALKIFSDIRSAYAENPEFYLRYSRSQAESGDVKGAIRTLRSSIRTFEDSKSLRMLLVTYDPLYINELSVQYFDIGDSSVFDAELLAEVVQHAADPALKRRLIDAYHSAFGENLTVAVEDALLGGSQSKETLKRITDLGLFADQRLTLRLYEGLASEEAKKELVTLFSQFSGSALLDENDDGIPEAVSVFESGKLVTRNVDTDQDEKPEFSLSFVDGRLYTAQLPEGITLIYSYYPFVKEISFVEGAPTRTLTLAARELSYPLVRLSPVPFFPPELTPPEALVQSKLEDLVQKGREVVEGTSLGSVDWTVFQDGMRRERTELPSGARVVRMYKDGLISWASLSVDDDDEPEVFEEYRNGNLITRRWDADHDGVDEYITRFGSPQVDLWDINADREPDIRRYLDNGYERYDYAQKLDGNFGVSLYVRDGVLSFVEKSGRRIPVVEDSGIRWIGGSPVAGFEFPSRVPSFVSRNEGLYFCFTLFGLSYTEVLK